MTVVSSCSEQPVGQSWIDDLNARAIQVSSKSERIQTEYDHRLRKAADGKNDEGNLRSLALFLHANDLYDAAMLAYEALIEAAPEEATWPYLYASILLDYGMMDKALEMLDRSLGLDETYALTYLKKADLLSKVGQRDLAVETYKVSLQHNPSLAHASLGLARMAIEDKDLEKALQFLNDAVKQDPTLSSSHFLLATVYEQQGNDEKAGIHRSLGTEWGRFREPSDPWTEQVYEHCFDAYKLSVIADTFGKTRRLDKALDYYEKALELDPTDGNLCLAMAQAYLKNGNKETGMRYLDEAIRLDPSNSNAYVCKAAEYAVDGMNRASLDVIEQGIKVAGPTAFFYRQRGMLMGAMGDQTGMELMYFKAVEFEPENVPCNITLANHLWSKGAEKMAVYYYEQARRLSVLEIKCRAVLASYYLEQGDLETAGACLEEIENVDGKLQGLNDLKAAFLLQKGNLAFRSKDWDTAESFYREAWELNPDSEEVANNWMKLLVDTGRIDEALQKLGDWVKNAKAPKLFHYRLAATICMQDGRIRIAEEWLKQGKQQAGFMGDVEAVHMFSKQLQLIGKSREL